MNNSFRISAVLQLDEDKEKGIANDISELASSHLIGKFISELLREAYKDRELIQRVYNKIGQLPTIEQKKTDKEYIAELRELISKADKLFDIAFDTYSMARLGKQIGIEGSARTELQSEFIVRRKAMAIADTLGIDTETLLECDIDEMEDRVDRVISLAIENYEPLISEIKTNRVQEVVYKEEADTVVVKDTVQVKAEEVVQTSVQENIETYSEEDDDVIDLDEEDTSTNESSFGDGVDLSALSQFLGI